MYDASRASILAFCPTCLPDGLPAFSLPLLLGFKVLLVGAKLNHSFNNVNPDLKKIRPQYMEHHSHICRDTQDLPSVSSLPAGKADRLDVLFTKGSFSTSRFEIPRTKNLIPQQNNKLKARATQGVVVAFGTC